MESQEELLRSVEKPDWFFDSNYPVWRCTCGWLNRFANTWGEVCEHCRVAHTTDWENLIVNGEIRKEWTSK
jgi:hypothetical protein